MDLPMKRTSLPVEICWGTAQMALTGLTAAKAATAMYVLFSMLQTDTGGQAIGKTRTSRQNTGQTENKWEGFHHELYASQH